MNALIKLILPLIVRGLSTGLDELLKEQEFAVYWNDLRHKLFSGYQKPAEITKNYTDGKEF